MTGSQIAVVIPALNRATMIERAIRSVHAQTVGPVEIIVVDDASSDDTAAVAARTGATVVRLPQRGGSGPARNAGIAKTKATWIAFLDSDDEWQPTHLELLLRQAGAATLVTAPARDTSGRIRGNASKKQVHVLPQLLLVPGDIVVTSGTMVRRDALIAAGLFRALPRAQDLDLWLRVLEMGHGVATAVPTVTYHEHPAQASKDQALMRQTLVSILDDYSDRRWLTRGVRTGSHAVQAWDIGRAAQRTGDWRAVARQAWWFLRHPDSVHAIALLLLHRRQSRAF